MMSPENMKVWDAVKKTDPTRTKDVPMGSKRKITAVDAFYQVEQATRMFGPCGLGWGLRNQQFTPLPCAGDHHYDRLMFTAELWYIHDGKEATLEIAADIELWEQVKDYDSKEKNAKKWSAVGDVVKKVRTDALTKGLSWIGFNADVHSGMFDDNKYVSQLLKEQEREARYGGEQPHPAAAPTPPAAPAPQKTGYVPRQKQAAEPQAAPVPAVAATSPAPVDLVAVTKKRLWDLARTKGLDQDGLQAYAQRNAYKPLEDCTVLELEALLDQLKAA